MERKPDGSAGTGDVVTSSRGLLAIEALERVLLPRTNVLAPEKAVSVRCGASARATGCATACSGDSCRTSRDKLCGVPSITNCERSSGVRLPFRGGVISKDAFRSRVEDWGVAARGRGVVFLDGGFVALVLGNKENPPEGPLMGDISSYRLLPVPSLCMRRLYICIFHLLPKPAERNRPSGPTTRTRNVSSQRGSACPATGAWYYGRDHRKGVW